MGISINYIDLEIIMSSFTNAEVKVERNQKSLSDNQTAQVSASHLKVSRLNIGSVNETSWPVFWGPGNKSAGHSVCMCVCMHSGKWVEQ